LPRRAGRVRVARPERDHTPPNGRPKESISRLHTVWGVQKSGFTNYEIAVIPLVIKKKKKKKKGKIFLIAA
jgi:hypothetical protein